VCPWCWNKIKETENGLCPACRTPYEEEPHAFTTVEMEAVVRDKKSKEGAEKAARRAETGGKGTSVPGDRNMLSGMRVIRRNLVYAVGLPGSCNSEDSVRDSKVSRVCVCERECVCLRERDSVCVCVFVCARARACLWACVGVHVEMRRGRREEWLPTEQTQCMRVRTVKQDDVNTLDNSPNSYLSPPPPSLFPASYLDLTLAASFQHFGQYGKISKVVLNRGTNIADPRRNSASAYVTFTHASDALCCILCLDGFWVDGRNIRASFGTSKYCSAFIKNVRCNNPDCTYLHYMGEGADSFSKQEIQAGYVTSGRDILQKMAQEYGANPPRKKVGGGGPSGTGKAATANVVVVFPQPKYDDPMYVKQQQQLQGGENKNSAPNGTLNSAHGAQAQGGYSSTGAPQPPPPAPGMQPPPAQVALQLRMERDRKEREEGAKGKKKGKKVQQVAVPPPAAVAPIAVQQPVVLQVRKT